jgi:hypothetical protein
MFGWTSLSGYSELFGKQRRQRNNYRHRRMSELANKVILITGHDIPLDGGQLAKL